MSATRTGDPLKTMVLLALFWCGMLQAVQAQQAEVAARLDEVRIPQGAQTVLTVAVKNSQPDDYPREINVDGLSIQHISTRHNTALVNGIMNSEWIVYYGVTGVKDGVYTIPPVELTIKGETYTTEPLALEVTEVTGEQALTADQQYFLRLEADKREVYMNELIPVELTLYSRGSSSIKGISSLELEGGEDFVIDQLGKTHRTSVTPVQGIPYATVRMPTNIFALSAGKFELGPASVQAKLESRSSLPSFFSMYEERQVISNPLDIVVKPLPGNGKPASFTGAVGRFDISVEASPVDLKVGDPISVDIRIQGEGNFDSILSPTIPQLEGWKVYRSNRVEEDDDADNGIGAVSFSQVVIPLAEHTELPAMELSYFDPASSSYGVASSSPIALNVRPDASLPAQPVVGSTAIASSGGAGIPVEQLEDILFIHTGSPAWIQIKPISWWKLHLLPVLLLVFVLVVWVLRLVQRFRHDETIEARTTIADVKERLSTDGVSRADYYRTVLEYLDTLGGEWEARVSRETRAALDPVRKAAGRFLYGGTPGPGGGDAVPAAERTQALHALEDVERNCGGGVRA